MTIPTPAQKRKILAEEYDPAPTLPPTPAQIEAAIKAMQKLWVHPTHDWQFRPMAEAALTAAAEVGPYKTHSVDFLEGIAEGKATTIERCAQEVPTTWLDELLTGKDAPKLPFGVCEVEALLRGIQDRIRKLKDEP